MSVASYSVVNISCTEAISNEAMETSHFCGRVSVQSFFARIVDVVNTDVAGNASPTLALTNEIGLGCFRYGPANHCARGKTKADRAI